MHILAIDQGTTSSRAILFNLQAEVIAQHKIPHHNQYPQMGWVEQDPLEILNNVITCCQQVVRQANISPRSILAVGITNQRETTIIWDRNTGKPIYSAIVWQDRRTAQQCENFQRQGLQNEFQQKTGLILDPYFSMSKISWLLNHVPGAKQRAQNGDLVFGTMDSFLLWHLSVEKNHITDVTNASRTGLMNLQSKTWDKTLLEVFDIPEVLLPKITANTHHFGLLHSNILGEEIPITAMIGDQQAAAVGQYCFTPGMMKATYGTGGFLLMNTGEHLARSSHQLLSTVLYQTQEACHYALEGSFFMAGASLNWLVNNVQLFEDVYQTETIALQVEDSGGVFFVPAMTGLGAPYWNPHAKGAWLGLSTQTQQGHMVRAVINAMGFQTADLCEAMIADSNLSIACLRVDGGCTKSSLLNQEIANRVGISVLQSELLEMTARGAAMMAGLGQGVFTSFDALLTFQASYNKYEVEMSTSARYAEYQKWLAAVKCVELFSDIPLLLQDANLDNIRKTR